MMGNVFIDRRRFVSWGALAGVLLLAGCSDGSAPPEQVTAPPAEKGNRNLIKKKAEVPPVKGKR